MQKITCFSVLDDTHIMFEFLTKQKKTLDLENLWNYPVFVFLKDAKNVSKLKNFGSYIEWTDFEADISADTIWHFSN